MGQGWGLGAAGGAGLADLPRLPAPSATCRQVFEDKQRLWMDELDELKQMYMAKLQQVTQQAQRSQRALQLQLYKAQQEKKRLQEELSLHQCQSEELRLRPLPPDRASPKLEEAKWEVSMEGPGRSPCAPPCPSCSPCPPGLGRLTAVSVVRTCSVRPGRAQLHRWFAHCAPVGWNPQAPASFWPAVPLPPAWGSAPGGCDQGGWGHKALNPPVLGRGSFDGGLQGWVPALCPASRAPVGLPEGG